MGFEKAPDLTEFVPGKTTASLQAHRVEPKFRLVAVPLNVNVRRFLEPILCVKVHPIRPLTKNGGHYAVVVAVREEPSLVQTALIPTPRHRNVSVPGLL